MFIDEAQSLLEKPKNENVAAAQRHLPAIRVIKNTGLRLGSQAVRRFVKASASSLVSVFTKRLRNSPSE